MVLFPNAKINLGLYITGRRADGFHDLETIFLPIPFRDSIELIKATDPSKGDFQFGTSGLSIEGPEEKNLCFRAWQILKKEYSHIPALEFHLLKQIPMGAGMGGGSSDGAFTLLLINKKFDLQIPRKKLIEYALQLGSDCPFFIINQPVFGSGRGEILEPIDIPSLKGYHIVVVFPSISVSTSWAFSRIKPGKPEKSLKEAILYPLAEWKSIIKNDFEAPVFEAYKEIADIKSTLYSAGALYASLSGSGSTVFGIYNEHDFKLPEFPGHYTVRTMELLPG
ncbi:4-(cytidine 5'-diphospho)-2-C-methyl-D-erythritol kinase [Pollutibacter soli]|uniref:4-(cytidine 5'-diphospho)-2-C-methyl-D-erythritol kinase n=1 Tax=Pollutibacter soli TaxID=3034157 RepID=UPI0030138A2B